MAKFATREPLSFSKPNGENFTLDYQVLRRAALALRAINHPLRRELLRMMEEGKKLTVTEMFTKLNLEQSVVSQHLALLRKGGYVSTERDGKFIFYSVNRKRVEEISKLIHDVAQSE